MNSRFSPSHSFHLKSVSAPSPPEDESILIRGEVDSLETRAGWSIVTLSVLLSGLHAWAGQLAIPALLAISSFLVLTGIAGLVIIWSKPRVSLATQLLLLFATVLAFAVYTTMITIGNPIYGTDEIAFDQFAAQLALRGGNPYLHTMAASLPIFHVPDIFHTYLLNGHEINALSYPAGSFLAYIPALALGFHTQTALVVDCLFWVIGIVLSWILLPGVVRWVPPLILLAAVYIDFAAGGVTDALYLPFLVLALWRWDRFAITTERSAARWIGPIALGIAATVKQTPWFLVPFLLLGIWFEASARGNGAVRVVGHYAGMFAITFGVINADYIVRSGGAWTRAILVPLLSPTEPGGQGLISYTMFSHLGGRLIFYTIAGLAAFLVALSAFIIWYHQLKRVFPFLVAAALYFPSRSFGSYLIMLLPAGLVGAMTVSAGQLPRSRWKLIGTSGLIIGMASLGTAGAAALTLPPSIQFSVVQEISTGQLQSVDYLRLDVSNTSGVTLWPHYAVNSTGQISSFWNVVSGPRRIAPFSTKTVTVEAPNVQSMPSVDSGFIVDAFTAHPAQMSSAREVSLTLQSTLLTPQDLNNLVPVGRTLIFRVQLVDRLDAPIRRSGVRIDLGQIIYEQSGLQYGEASINRQSAGESPVSSMTNSQGIATFSVCETQEQGAPLFLQAWIDQNFRPPTGYSNIVDVQFKVPSKAAFTPRAHQ